MRCLQRYSQFSFYVCRAVLGDIWGKDQPRVGTNSRVLRES